MGFMRSASLAGILLLFSTGAVQSQDIIQQVGANGTIDYSRRVVTATGIGMPGGLGGRAGQIRAAKLDALRNLIEALNGITLTSATSVQDLRSSSDVVKTRVEGIAKNYRITGPERSFDDGSLEVTIEMSLDGPFLEAILPDKIGNRAQPLTAAGGGKIYTGLIIDASGLDARPALAPRILNEQGQEVYGSSFVSREWAIKFGLVGYVKDMSSAVSNDRVAAQPLVTRALRVTGSNRTDLVISDQDAKILHTMRENLSFLEKCRVIIVLN